MSAHSSTTFERHATNGDPVADSHEGLIAANSVINTLKTATTGTRQFRHGLTRLPIGPLALIACLATGALLRTIWVDDIEYKADEAWTFERTQHVGIDEPIPTLGMPTSYEVRHPGGTIWV